MRTGARVIEHRCAGHLRTGAPFQHKPALALSDAALLAAPYPASAFSAAAGSPPRWPPRSPDRGGASRALTVG